jgi:hypothetical protein
MMVRLLALFMCLSILAQNVEFMGGEDGGCTTDTDCMEKFGGDGYGLPCVDPTPGYDESDDCPADDDGAGSAGGI